MFSHFFAITRMLLISMVFAVVASASLPVQLLSERHRSEWNWTEYRISLRNTSELPILGPEILYFAANPLTRVHADFVSVPFSVTDTVISADQSAVIRFKVHGLLFPGTQVDVHFRLYKDGWDTLNLTDDWSYQKNPEVVEPQYFMAVYDGAGNILWGFDPLKGNYNAETVLWIDRGNKYSIGRFDGDTSETVPAGRFWMFKDVPLSPKERDLLAARGIVKYSVGVYQGKTLVLFRCESGTRKALLDSLVAGFYNAIAVNDTTPVEVDVRPEDLYEDRVTCDSNGTCHTETVARTEFDMNIVCWPDAFVDSCYGIVETCGGIDIGVARELIVAKMSKDSVQCLSQNRNVRGLYVEHELELASEMGRNAVNISALQQGPAWQAALSSDKATMDWLSGVDYTGDSILVGVYDEGFDFSHPAFNEDSSGVSVQRTMREYEFYGLRERAKTLNFGLKNRHGTVIAGIIGGNGNNSENFRYRGVAPKVHFYPYAGGIYYRQVGHVVNHSHKLSEKGFYVFADYSTDNAIFKNWKSTCTKIYQTQPEGVGNCVEGDTLTKTVVYSAGNYGGMNLQFGVNRGYYSVLVNAKNPIVVGNITSKEKLRFHNSSMGPTWDGRIKPDVMAPGSTSQFAVNENNPIQVQIDYVKLFHSGESSPYFNLDFGRDTLPIDSQNMSCISPRIVAVDGGSVFDCLYNGTDHSEINLGWVLGTIDSVRSTDSIEVRLRRVQGGENDGLIYGKVLFGTEAGGLSLSYRDIPAVWAFADTFSVSRFSLDVLNESILPYFLRLDFTFTRGVIAPDICRMDSCGYAYLWEGGTSESAPFVSGIAALMYQKFHKLTGDPLDKHSMRNSTVKALMIHTAIDMEDSEDAHFIPNPDLTASHQDGRPHYTRYGRGPDFATGWGRVDGKAALDMISGYDARKKEFAKFREIEIGNATEKRWSISVEPGRQRLRTTLVWDDAPSDVDSVLPKQPKLLNDLDMYLVSPSGQYYYPWRLNPLPSSFITPAGRNSDSRTGFERIYTDDIMDAYVGCSSSDKLDSLCFDHLNNVEVVDVDLPEPGIWQVVVFGRNVHEFNNAENDAQVATLVSDDTLGAEERCNVNHGYAAQSDYSCTYELGEQSISYVTFSDSTFVGAGDTIRLYDENNALLGAYTGFQLAGKRVKFRTRRFTVTLQSDNDNSQGWGFAVSKIMVIPYSALKMPFNILTKKRRTP